MTDEELQAFVDKANVAITEKLLSRGFPREVIEKDGWLTSADVLRKYLKGQDGL